MPRKLKKKKTPGELLAVRYNWCQGPVSGRGLAVEKHWTTQSRFNDNCLQIPFQFLETLIITNRNIFKIICGKINKYICEVSGFRRAVLDVFTHLGCYTTLFGSYLPKFRDTLSVPSSKGQTMTLEDGTDRLSRNVRKQLPTKAA